MLLWQPQNSLKIRSVFLVSLVLHVVVCFSLLFIYKDYHQRLVVDFSSRIPSNAIVRLLPLSASRSSSRVLGVKSGKGGAQKSGKKSRGKSSAAAVASKQIKKKPSTSLVKEAVTGKSVKPGKGKKALAEKAKNSVQTKKMLEQKKVLDELQKQKAEKLAQAKKGQEVAKEESKLLEKQLAKEEQKIVETKKQEVVESAQVPKNDHASLGEINESSVGPEGQEILYLTKQEFDALQIQQKLQECLFGIWTPPAGIPSGVLCEVLITVGWDGAILETQFLKKTEILMYDLSVQETLEQVTFPHEVWGKHITITFKP